jgi:hypothetical protein
MINKIVLSIIAGLLASTLTLFSQRESHLLTGKVTDEKYRSWLGQPIYFEELGIVAVQIYQEISVSSRYRLTTSRCGKLHGLQGQIPGRSNFNEGNSIGRKISICQPMTAYCGKWRCLEFVVSVRRKDGWTY